MLAKTLAEPLHGMRMSHFDLEPWSTDWAGGIPLIVVTVIVHVIGLGLPR
jgi:hypothetical protein